MQIEFKKVKSTPFNVSNEDVVFSGTIQKIKDDLVEIDGKIAGKSKAICSRCGKEIELLIDENLKLRVSDGIYDTKHIEDEDDDIVVVESFNHKIDCLDILNSEIESILSDYIYCEDCSKIDNIEYEI